MDRRQASERLGSIKFDTVISFFRGVVISFFRGVVLDDDSRTSGRGTKGGREDNVHCLLLSAPSAGVSVVRTFLRRDPRHDPRSAPYRVEGVCY